MSTRNYSLRSSEWLDFSSAIFKHIETYTVPQYGDKGSDQCSEFSESEYRFLKEKLARLLNEKLARQSLNSNDPNDRYGLDQLEELLNPKETWRGI